VPFTGSEESFLEAMKRFGERHFDQLRRRSTMFLCLESVGSPELMLLSGEGLLRLPRYPPEQIRTLSRLPRPASRCEIRFATGLRPTGRSRFAPGIRPR
jgi:hypothetical protein